MVDVGPKGPTLTATRTMETRPGLSHSVRRGVCAGMSFMAWGLAWPRVAFMTWPTKKFEDALRCRI